MYKVTKQSCFICLFVVAALVNISSAAQIDVSSGVPDAIVTAVAGANAGDVINLTDIGPYQITQPIINNVAVTVQGDPSIDHPKIEVMLASISFFEPAADLKIQNLEIDGRLSGVWASSRAISSKTPVDNIWVEDVVAHHLDDDFFRIEGHHGLVSIINAFVYVISDSPLDFRSGDLDTLVVKNTTFYKSTTKHRIDLVMQSATFDHVTHVSTNDPVFNFRVAQPNVVITNSLFINNFEEVFDFETADGKTIDYCNAWNDTAIIVPAGGEPAIDGGAGEDAWNAGYGNFQEDPQFADTAALNFKVGAGTNSSFGSEDGGVLGDPRWESAGTVVENIEMTILKNYLLSQNYPNPFNPETTIQYDLPIASSVNLSVYNMLGQEIVNLVDATQTHGRYTVKWNGRDAKGNVLNGGIYFYRLQANNEIQIRKMILLK